MPKTVRKKTKSVETNESVGIQMGKKVPAFSLPQTGESLFKLSDLKGRNLVLFFYPKDMTSGCTREAQDFAVSYSQFLKLKTEVIGVSRDSMVSHEKFCEKYQLPFSLLSDEDEKVCDLFGVLKMKSMYGRKFKGIERSTFVIDGQGILRGEWRGVKVPEHVEEVLTFVRGMSKSS